MESQMARPHGVHDYEHDPNNVGRLHPEGEDGYHHEKKSVLKKVMDKAKKLKDKVKLHGHVPDDHDLYEEDDDEDEEMVEDTEVHGASGLLLLASMSINTYYSAAIRNSVQGQGLGLGNPRTSYGDPTTMQKEHTGTDPMKSSLPGQEVLVGRTTALKEVTHAPVNSPASFSPATVEQGFVHEQERIRGQPEVNLKIPVGLEEDPHAPKGRLGDHAPSNYQTKVTDPTGSGGKEAGITPILHSFNKMNIDDESRGEKQNLSTGSRDGQLSLLPTGSHDQFSAEPTPPISISSQENPVSGSKSFVTLKAKEHTLGGIGDKPSNQSSYTEKISSATSAISDKAKAATNVIASNLGYGERDNNTKEHTMTHEGQGQNAAKPASTVEYGKKIATTVTEKLTPVYEKVAGVGSTVMSKLHGNTNASTNTSNEAESRIEGKDKGVSVKDYFAEKLRPGEEDRALSEVISETLNKGKTETGMWKNGSPMGKVTDSEEVEKRLGSGEEENSDEITDSVSVVDKLKGAVGSLFVKSEESRASQQHPLSSSIAGKN
ncbi:low-temperature-induced 65 kDa protein-like [Populus alba x Populus x berolinensis]|uniref:Low-temperature-induced 65 kDa protein-like n=1 Tax=Populus alba x Populus x berolinensis TaxID=444605 RepID=A0AAD6Q463_9ROSI|nr:low-temperature-induced 65 kDa protein-like [Populus alba x Populus x berolinensis]